MYKHINKRNTFETYITETAKFLICEAHAETDRNRFLRYNRGCVCAPATTLNVRAIPFDLLSITHALLENRIYAQVRS